MRAPRSLYSVAALLTLSACTTTSSEHDPSQDLGILWVKHSAEYRANALQTYRDAREDLPQLLNDTTWDALRGHGDPSTLPPAVILDVDETVVSNVDFQMTFERPFANHKLDTWSRSRDSLGVPGVQAFVSTARELGIAVYFVTNRPCEPVDGNDDPCPQKQTTVDDILELGIPVDPEYVMLSGERPDWDREKSSRREYVAKTHRIIMLIGDDLSDFVPCVRESQRGACSNAATSESRAAALKQFADFWGNGWYILPNPMHGSWTSFD
jgi:5'-nucleotidase (lipoprotein e(P4) family)